MKNTSAAQPQTVPSPANQAHTIERSAPNQNKFEKIGNKQQEK
jgi:hypothetical protein